MNFVDLFGNYKIVIAYARNDVCVCARDAFVLFIVDRRKYDCQ